MGFSKGFWIRGQLVLFTMETMAIELVICFSHFVLDFYEGVVNQGFPIIGGKDGLYLVVFLCS